MNPESLTEKDLEKIDELQPAGWPDITESFGFYLKSTFCSPVKIIIDNEIAGIGSGNSFGRTAWLSHIITKPAFRNRGVAASIVEYLHKSLSDSGSKTVSLIATESGYPVYKRAGFTVQTEYVFFERTVPFRDLNQSENIIQYKDEFKDSVYAMDRKISGEDRSSLLGEKLHSSFVYLKKGTVSGYYIPESGEGLIAAETSEAGLELLKARCLLFKSCVLPCENIGAIKFLKEHDYAETKRARRMISGMEFEWHPEKLYSRIGGNFG